jgi:hypothetical protein
MSDKRTNSTPPKWWTNVIADIEKAVVVSKKSFIQPNTVLSSKLGSEGEILGYYIRQESRGIGFYSMEDLKHELPVGDVIRGKLPKPRSILEDMSISSFITETISSNIRLVPIMWLSKTVNKIVSGVAIQFPTDFREFPSWVALPISRKKDKTLIDLLYRAVRYEGLKGLARYNDYSAK